MYLIYPFSVKLSVKTKFKQVLLKSDVKKVLTHCGLVTSFGDIDLV